MEIPKFYEGREIFITGATGYLGKSLLEKLLRSCPGITKIFILLRGKQGKTAMERLKDFQNERIFERIHRECPEVLNKIIPIVGNCHDIGLGISEEDLKLLKDVSVVFHEAAYVKFDNDFRSSILANTRGTHELVKIALNLKNIIAFVHVSTAYICPHETDIEEKPYRSALDWRKTIHIAETYDTQTLEAVKTHYTNFSPTVYTFSKYLAENIISDYSDRLPMAILRPSIVSHSYTDPEPGFMDNINGTVGLVATIVIGLSQMSYVEPDVNLSFMPVDLVTAFTITGAYKRGLETLKCRQYPLTIANLAPRDAFKFTSGQATKRIVQVCNENPMQYTVWAPAPRMTACYAWYMTWVFLVQIPMALVYDTLLVCFKKDPMLVKTMRRIVYAVKALSKFSTKHFNMKNEGMWELLNIMKTVDKTGAFNFIDVNNLDFDLIFRGYVYGFKKHIFKEPTEATPETKQRYKILLYLNEIVKLILFVLVVKYLWHVVN